MTCIAPFLSKRSRLLIDNAKTPSHQSKLIYSYDVIGPCGRSLLSIPWWFVHRSLYMIPLPVRHSRAGCPWMQVLATVSRFSGWNVHVDAMCYPNLILWTCCGSRLSGCRKYDGGWWFILFAIGATVPEVLLPVGRTGNAAGTTSCSAARVAKAGIVERLKCGKTATDYD